VRSVAAFLAALAIAPAAAASPRFVIEGHGWGHGVGMSQWGAYGLALHGWRYRQILAHYYPGTTLAREPNVTVRVLVATDRRRVAVSSKSAFVVISHGSRKVVHGRIVARGKRTVTFVPGAQPLTLDGDGYRGRLVWHAGSVVNVLPLERYLRGVVPWEMPHRWSRAALEAQAVAARSYALATMRHVLYPDTRDQEYGGIRAETPQTNAAIGATAGRVLTWDGHPALTYYFSTSGGRTAAARDSLPWAPSVPYLVSVSDPYDGLSPHHSWSYAFTARRLARALHVPGVHALALELNSSGRVAEVVARWRGGARTIDGRTFSFDLDLPSTWFSVVHGAKPAAPAASAPAAPHLKGWIVVVSSVPVGEGKPRGRVLRSDDYGLAPGYWVVYRGPYPTAAAAQARASGGAYARKLGG
jgi:stage II sporulation protein D